MAMSFSQATSVRSIYKQPQPSSTSKNNHHPPKALLSISLRGSGSGSGSLSSCSSVGKFQAQVSRLSARPRALSRKRTLDIKCATMEEIEAEKSSIEKNVRDKMEKALENLKSAFSSIRTGRSNPAMLDKIHVEYYGSPVSLKSIAQITSPDASSLLVSPYDKSSLKIIEKAIVSSNLGLSPSNDGEVIRLSIPPLTADRRKELSKVVAKQAEEGKVALRNIRREGLKAYEKLEKDKKISEDNVKDLSADLQKLMDEYMKKVESLFKQKEKEVLTV